MAQFILIIKLPMSDVLVKEITFCDPLSIFAHFAEQNGAILLDSAECRPWCGRYSYIAIDPFLTLTSKNGVMQLNEQMIHGDPWQVLADQLAQFPAERLADLPPFQGGMAGFFSYDLIQHLESIPRAHDDFHFPDLAVGFYDLIMAFDHLEKRAWIFSTGYPEKNLDCRQIRAVARVTVFEEKLKHIQPLSTSLNVKIYPDQIQAHFSQAHYEASVKEVIDYILAGDIFEANLSQRFKATLPAHFAPFTLYRRLRHFNPAPFASFMTFDDATVVSASPERFLQLSHKQVETRPIKGTRARSDNALVDQQLAEELLRSHKDRAENIMIVDLLRNDLSRVCKPHSVTVPQLCGLESFATVHHLVSVVRGELKNEYHALDVLRAAFPGGSITGAPKIRAMEIIATLEPTARGLYCGCIGYIGFNGEMDTAIAIRTFCIKNSTVTFQAGGAIVLDSDPTEEYEETLTKARALIRALTHDIVD